MFLGGTILSEKMNMRRLFLTASLALVGATLAQPVDAQISFGAQGAYLTGLEDLSGVSGATDLNGTVGIGARAMFSPPIPMLSLGIVGQGVYYFPEGNGSYMTYGLGGKVGLGLPMITPYVIGGWQWRRSDNGSGVSGSTTTENGFTAGVGVQLGMVPVFVEATMEFNDEIPTAPNFDVNPLVLQAGIMLGG